MVSKVSVPLAELAALVLSGCGLAGNPAGFLRMPGKQAEKFAIGRDDRLG
jgi:hypothetical protein